MLVDWSWPASTVVKSWAAVKTWAVVRGWASFGRGQKLGRGRKLGRGQKLGQFWPWSDWRRDGTPVGMERAPFARARARAYWGTKERGGGGGGGGVWAVGVRHSQ